jgi:transcriptional regulator with XRE-family HTH domain
MSSNENKHFAGIGGDKMEPNIEHIEKLMEERKLTLRGLARLADVSPTAIHKVLRRKGGAGNVVIDGLIKAFPDVKLDKLFFLPNSSSNDDNKRKRGNK